MSMYCFLNGNRFRTFAPNRFALINFFTLFYIDLVHKNIFTIIFRLPLDDLHDVNGADSTDSIAADGAGKRMGTSLEGCGNQLPP